MGSVHKIALTGANIFTGEETFDQSSVLLSGDEIDGICPDTGIPSEYEIQALSGGLLAPGFIDIQVNGGGGVFLNDDPSVAGLRKIAAAHRQFGTTSMLPTLITDSLDKMKLACAAVEEARQLNQPGILGIHLEGPYLNVIRKGVHDPDVIREFENELYNLLSIERLGPSILTVAPETLADGILEKLVATGFKICAGHTAATYEDIRTALDKGLTGFTHLFNAMTPMESRDPGVVGAALEDKHSYCGIIADGYHIHPATLKVAIAAKEKGHMILVTDAMASVGAEEKAFKIRGEEITVEKGRCMTKDGTLAGSDLDMIGAVKNTVEMADLSMEEALRMASLYPARYMGIDNRLGRIKSGYQADIVHISDGYQISETWIKGVGKKHL